MSTTEVPDDTTDVVATSDLRHEEHVEAPLESTPAPEVDEPTEPASLWRLGVVVALFGLLWRFGGTGAVIMLVGFVVLIVCHELGHYLAARRAGMKVTEFFLGFGPKIWSTTRGETEYGMKMIPAGAYVKIIGMNNLEKVDPADETRTYRHGSYLNRMSVVLAGPVVNLTLGFLGLLVLYMGWGFIGVDAMTSGVDESNWVVGAVSAEDSLGEETAAAQIGLQPGDSIVAVDGESVETWSEVVDAVSSLAPGTEITVTVARDDQTFDESGELGTRVGDDGTKYGFLGVGPSFPGLVAEPLGLGPAIAESADDYGEIVKQSLAGIAALVKPSTWQSMLDFGDAPATVEAKSGAAAPGPQASSAEAERNFVGAVGIIDLASGITQLGALLFLWCLINVFVGLFNLVPLLPFDGGHAIVATFEEIRARISGDRDYRVDYARLVPLTVTVVAVLVFFFVVVTSRDVMHIVDRVN